MIQERALDQPRAKNTKGPSRFFLFERDVPTRDVTG